MWSAGAHSSQLLDKRQCKGKGRDKGKARIRPRIPKVRAKVGLIRRSKTLFNLGDHRP